MITSLCVTVVIIIGWRILNWVWIRPKKLEKIVRNQGFKGSSYRLLYGDTKDFPAIEKEAVSKPINLSDDFIPRGALSIFLSLVIMVMQILFVYSVLWFENSLISQ